MGASLHKTKRRIASVNSTKKITKAMELVATVKLKRFKDVMLKNSLYQKEMLRVIHHLFSRLGNEVDVSYTKEGKSDKDLYVIINSNLGLCASYNNDIYSFVDNNVSKENTAILPIGIKGDSHYSKEGYEINNGFISLNEKIKYDDVVELGNYLHKEFLDGNYRNIYLIYTKYVNSIKFVPDMMKVFPLKEEDSSESLGYEPMYDPNVKTLIEELVPIYINSTLYQKIIESQVSEQASRRTAMENATDNADEIIDQLTLEYNKARQTAITQEISEIISGTIK